MFKNKKVLVTGGTGMVGRELVQLLLDRGANVRVVSLDKPTDFFKEVEFIEKDLMIYQNCLDVCSEMDYVFHVCGIKSSASMPKIKPLNYFIPMITFNTNMMEAAYQSGVKWYMYTSSVGVYHPAEVFHEDDVWNTFPSDNDRLPGWAKRIGELQAEGYKIQYDWNNISIVRPANIYGNWDDFDLETAQVIPSLIRKGEESGKNGTMNVWGDGSPIRDFIHARDIARGMLFVVENKITKPVNLGSGSGVKISDLISIISERFKCNVKYDITKPNGDLKRVMNIDRIKSYGFELSVDIKDGINETIEWYLNNKQNLDYRYNPFK